MEGVGDVGEGEGGVGEVRGDDDGPWQRSGATGSKGERAPFFFFFLDLLPRWEKGSPYGPWTSWHGRVLPLEHCVGFPLKRKG